MRPNLLYLSDCLLTAWMVICLIVTPIKAPKCPTSSHEYAAVMQSHQPAFLMSVILNAYRDNFVTWNRERVRGGWMDRQRALERARIQILISSGFIFLLPTVLHNALIQSCLSNLHNSVCFFLWLLPFTTAVFTFKPDDSTHCLILWV